MTKIRVFHVEDYKIMRDGVRHMMDDDDDIEIIGEANTGEELLAKLLMIEVDVLILDIYLDAMEDLQQMNGFELCQLIVERYPTMKIVAHSVYDDADRVARIIKAGAIGFVSKKSGFEELRHAIKIIATGEVYICVETSKRLKNLNKFLMGIEDNLKSNYEVFSQREREILGMLATGHSSKEIANTLFITERTVDSHRKNMMEKGHVKNTAELIAYASSLGFIRK